jgi:FecR protein
MRFPTSPALFSFALVAALPALASEQAGVSAAVRGDVALNRLQVAVGRQVVSGEPILLQDAIRSGARSGMQILLLDETVFTIGPESELVIDEFVYDPSSNAGKLGARVTKGVFRFISGKIAHENPQDMELKLPSGTLGVRGTMVAGRVDATQKSSRLVLLGEGPENDTGSPAGAFEACNAGKCVRINRAGYGTIIDGPDSPPVRPFRFSSEEIDAITRPVSDPEGWVETATSESDGMPDVAAGPDGAPGGGGDPRSATEVSGITSASGAENGNATRARLRTLEGLDQATTDVAQFSGQSVDVNGHVVELPVDCSDATSCLQQLDPFGVLGPIQNYLPEEITTFDQLSTLPQTGQLLYQQSRLGLVDTAGNPDGLYDFSLEVSLGTQTASLSISNLNSSSLGLSGVSFGDDAIDFSSYPTGYDIPAVFGVTTQVVGSVDSACVNGCDAVGGAALFNGNGRIADSALPVVVITAPVVTGEPVLETISASVEPIPQIQP